MSIKVLVNGAFGRMGLITVTAINQQPTLSLVGQTGREYDLTKAIRDSQAEVVVDFTHADVGFQNAITIIEAGACPVIGTSGLTQDQIKHLKDICKERKQGGIAAPNFSIGAVLMMQCAEKIAAHMSHVEIIEMHHDAKKDSPSGTAMRSAEMIAASGKLAAAAIPTTETIPGARGASYAGIPIHAIRLPGLLAHQQIIFGNTGETLTLRHDSIDRQCFMPGVCLACEKVVALKHFAYGLEEIL
ncbi:MAG TPA: 4-hydroxy-tetrahydrodipicolinate reductase [Gammaproteobacteria bacterium]|jgi:4-hydroxy-tetrahydrodipicolinate reductase|nr:4-hydroxy-tetrahydrodipicolinate reductase [Gammaproteobacteria bacterium]